jgi:hypothetical protein
MWFLAGAHSASQCCERQTNITSGSLFWLLAGLAGAWVLCMAGAWVLVAGWCWGSRVPTIRDLICLSADTADTVLELDPCAPVIACWGVLR